MPAVADRPDSGYGQPSEVNPRTTDLTPEERILKAIEELAARWHRTTLRSDDFTAGRRAGYVQAIALLANDEYSAVLDSLLMDEL